MQLKGESVLTVGFQTVISHSTISLCVTEQHVSYGYDSTFLSHSSIMAIFETNLKIDGSLTTAKDNEFGTTHVNRV